MLLVSEKNRMEMVVIILNPDVAYTNKKYLQKSKAFFQKHSAKMVEANHYQHNQEPNYWNYMLADLMQKNGAFNGSAALEYGCGAGRNLVNMGVLGEFSRVDGIDISKNNAINAQAFADLKLNSFGVKSTCLEGDGYTCLPFKSDFYQFIISHQVFIHIPNYEIRKSIIFEIKRLLKDGGIFICHFMTIGDAVGYFENYNSFPKNVQPDSHEMLEKDFSNYGFSTVEVSEVKNFVNSQPEWYVRCVK